MCSPKRGELSMRSTARFQAPGWESARNMASSCSVGGSPSRSKASRRSSVRRLAGGDMDNPAACCRAWMKVSTALRAGESPSVGTVGGGRRTGGTSDQCRRNSPPWAIHRLIKSCWALVSRRLDSSGGIRTSGSLLETFCQRRLFCGWPATSSGGSWARALVAISSRRSDFRAFASGP